MNAAGAIKGRRIGKEPAWTIQAQEITPSHVQRPWLNWDAAASLNRNAQILGWTRGLLTDVKSRDVVRLVFPPRLHRCLEQVPCVFPSKELESFPSTDRRNHVHKLTRPLVQLCQ